MSNWKALDNYVIVKIAEVKEQTESGIYIPGTVDAGVGVVVAAKEKDYGPGDEVLFSKSDLVQLPGLPNGQGILHWEHIFAWRAKE